MECASRRNLTNLFKILQILVLLMSDFCWICKDLLDLLSLASRTTIKGDNEALSKMLKALVASDFIQRTEMDAE